MTTVGAVVTLFRDLVRSGLKVEHGVSLDRIPFVVIDTELTGLDPKKDSVVSVGAVRMRGTRIEVGQSYYRLLRPSTTMGHAGILVHGITPGDVAGQPTIVDVGSEFREFCRDRIIAGHVISLDFTFLDKEVPGFRAPEEAHHAVDTLSIHRWMEQHRHSGHYTVPEGGMSLFTLAQRYGIRINGAHNSLHDAFMTAQLLQRQMCRLSTLGVRNLGDLLHVGKP